MFTGCNDCLNAADCIHFDRCRRKQPDPALPTTLHLKQRTNRHNSTIVTAKLHRLSRILRNAKIHRDYWHSPEYAMFAAQQKHAEV